MENILDKLLSYIFKPQGVDLVNKDNVSNAIQQAEVQAGKDMDLIRSGKLNASEYSGINMMPIIQRMASQSGVQANPISSRLPNYAYPQKMAIGLLESMAMGNVDQNRTAINAYQQLQKGSDISDIQRKALQAVGRENMVNVMGMTAGVQDKSDLFNQGVPIKDLREYEKAFNKKNMVKLRELGDKYADDARFQVHKSVYKDLMDDTAKGVDIPKEATKTIVPSARPDKVQTLQQPRDEKLGYVYSDIAEKETVAPHNVRDLNLNIVRNMVENPSSDWRYRLNFIQKNYPNDPQMQQAVLDAIKQLLKKGL